jgi:hypothetical protein
MTQLLLMMTLACVDDSYDGDPLTDTATGTDSASETETGGGGGGGGAADITSGTWVSEGDDISALLAYFEVVRVEATFGGDGRYAVVSTDAEGAVTTFTGSYTTDRATIPHGIVLTQTTPTSATAEGIWQVSDATLAYEVVQTSPAVGCSPPTPDGGFGSTRCSPPLNRNANVQTFRLR